MVLNVTNPLGSKKFQIKISPGDTIFKLKQVIKEATGSFPNYLTFDGVPINNAYSEINSVGLKNGDTVVVDEPVCDE